MILNFEECIKDLNDSVIAPFEQALQCDFHFLRHMYLDCSLRERTNNYAVEEFVAASKFIAQLFTFKS